MTVRRLFVLIFALSLFAMALQRADDPDMWWHLRTGQVILEEGIPYRDIFSFTVTEHSWVTHEWLSQVFMWGVYSIAGFPGLILAFALIISLTYWILYRSCPGRPYLAAFITVLAASAAALVWGSRPQMFNSLFMALFVYIIERYRQQRRMARQGGGGGSPRLLLWLPPLTILWANLHSGYLLGVVLIATYAAGEAAQLLLPSDKRERLGWRGVRELAAVAVGAFLAALLNPNGYKLWLYPLETLGSPVMQSQIFEWRSPSFHEPYNWPFALLLALGLLSWIVSKRQPNWADVLLYMGTAAAGLVSMRHIPIFAVASAPILARNFLSAAEGSRLYPLLSGEMPERTGGGRGHALLNGLLLALMALFVIGRAAVVISENPELVAERYPEKAIDYLEREGLADERGYNSYNWGGYLIWRGIPVFVDGRADVYGDEFLRFYLKAFNGEETWQQPLEQYGVEYVLMEPNSSLVALLKLSEEWREVYRDELATIFVRVLE